MASPRWSVSSARCVKSSLSVPLPKVRTVKPSGTPTSAMMSFISPAISWRTPKDCVWTTTGRRAVLPSAETGPLSVR